MPHHDKQEPRCQHPHLSWDILFYKAVCPTCGMFFVPRESAPSAEQQADDDAPRPCIRHLRNSLCAPSHEPRITQKELEQAINRLGLDNDLNTPDFRVAEIIFGNVEKWRDSSERTNDRLA